MNKKILPIVGVTGIIGVYVFVPMTAPQIRPKPEGVIVTKKEFSAPLKDYKKASDFTEQVASLIGIYN